MKPFDHCPALIGMIHVGALPGTPRAALSVEALTAQAVAEAKLYDELGLDAIMLENMHDRPYLKGDVGPEIVAVMTHIAGAVRDVTSRPLGVQVLAAANEAALAVAMAANLQFIRVEGFVFSHVADEGWIDGCAGQLLRDRKRLGAEEVAIWTDIKKKHSAHAVTSDVSLAETAEAAAFCRSDALIITGTHTGSPADPGDLHSVKRAVPETPVYIGSGITAENAAEFAQADGFIVGSSLKRDGHWANAPDRDRVAALLESVRRL